MKKRTSFENWVRKLVSNLCKYFSLEQWYVYVHFSEEDKGPIYAENSIDGTYLISTISVYPAAKKDFEGGNVDRLIMAVTHELVHILLDPFHESILPFLSPSTTPVFMNTLEQQNQKLTRVFLKTLPKSIIPPR